MRGFAVRFWVSAAWISAMACLLALPGQAGAVTQTFSGQETFTVPEGVTSLYVVADGEGAGERSDYARGLGAELSGELAVSPGEILYIHAREDNGGNAGEWVESGGGSSSIATSSKLTPGNVLVMAGGGGGSGSSTTSAYGGSRGGNAGEGAPNGASEGKGNFGEGGGPGTLIEGGLGGLACGSSTSRAGSGRFDQGGGGVNVREDQNGDGFIEASSGNGGGGYYGGGGGGRGCTNSTTHEATEGAGGGGGSSFTPLGWSEALAPSGTVGQVKVKYGAVAAPTVTSISPGIGKGGGGTRVEITGTNLESVQSVDFGTHAIREFTIESNTAITATAPRGEGTVAVTVTGLEGTSTVEPGDDFTYETALVITGISPEETTSAGGTPVTITGTGFKNVRSIEFGTKLATDVEVESETQIKAVTPAGNGKVRVVIFTANETSRAFSYTYGNPQITAISPEFGPSKGGTVVKITGERFREVESVSFGGTPATSFTVLTEHLIEAVAPSAEAQQEREDFVKVTNADGADYSLQQFRYEFPPTVEKLKPKSGSTAGGTEVQITGKSLLDATEVHFGSEAVTSFTVTEEKSSDVLTVISPPGIPGKVAITVTSPLGTSASSKKYEFTYKGTPTVTGLSPSSGPTAGGTSVEVSGTGFALGDATNFEFGSVEATSVDCSSNTSCTVQAPAAKSGKAGEVAVVATSGKKKSPTSEADEFTYE